MRQPPSYALALLLLSALQACSHDVKQTPIKPNATLQDLMRSVIDPAADALWNSVGSTITQAGTVTKQPHTEQEWQALKQQALALIDGAELLLIEGRAVAAQGVKSENPDIEANPEEVQRLIDADRTSFTKLAIALRATGEQALTAISVKNSAGLIEVGGKIDEVCEQCHQRFWYPNQLKPH